MLNSEINKIKFYLNLFYFCIRKSHTVKSDVKKQNSDINYTQIWVLHTYTNIIFTKVLFEYAQV